MKKLKLPFWLEKTLCKQFSMMYVEMEFIIKNPNGKIISSHKQIGKSVNENFLSSFYTGVHNCGVTTAYGFTAPHTSYKSVFQNNSSEVLLPNANTNFYCIGVANNDQYGIVVGTGAPSILPNTRALTAKIAQGVGVGQLVHNQQQSALGVTVLGSQSSLILTRTFLNSSGGLINVAECGIQANIATAFPVLIYIDAISPTAAVNNLQTLTINITFQITT